MTDISPKRLRELELAERKLRALEAGGVDNWEWYGESLKEFNKENEIEDIIFRFVESVVEEITVEADVEYPAGREAGHSILPADHSEERIIEWTYKLLEKYSEIQGKD